MSRLLEFTDDVREVRGYHRGPVTVLNLSNTDKLWVDDDPSVAPGAGLPIEPSGVTVFTPSDGHIYYVRDTTHVGASNPRAMLTRGAGAYINPAANRTPPVSGLTYIGFLNTAVGQTYPVAGFNSLRVFITNITGVGNDMVIGFNNSKGGGSAGIILGGVGASGAHVGNAGAYFPTGGAVVMPCLGDTINVNGYANTTATIYGSNDQVEGLTGFPNQRGGVMTLAMNAGGGQSAFAGSAFGPCKMDWTVWCADATTDGYFTFGTQGGNNIGFCDTKGLLTTSRGLSGRGSCITPAGLSQILYNQQAATTGGTVILGITLTPLNS